MNHIIRLLAEGGGYNLPYLLHIYDDNMKISLYVINDNKDLVYEGITYKSSAFTYNPKNDGSASLEIELSQNDQLINLVETTIETFHVDAVGVLNDGTVTPLAMYSNKYGEATWDGKKMKVSLNKDDRGDMTFPALIWTNCNNRGNA